MAKNQEARKRKHASRNGSSGRGNGADVGRLNGKSKHKTVDETPAWQKTLGAFVLIGAVLAAAFLTGVIRIDRNIDTEEAQDSIQEAQPTVAEINDTNANKTTTKYNLKEPNAKQSSQETYEESSFRDNDYKEEDKNSAKDIKLEDKATKVESRTSDQTDGVKRSQERNSDIPAKANATKKKRDTLNIPEVTIDEEEKVKKNDKLREDKAKDITQEHGSREKKKKDKTEPIPEDSLKEETPKKSREENGNPSQGDEDKEDKSSKTKESTVQETDSPKGKMVTPKRSPKNERKSKESKNKPSPTNDVKTNARETFKQSETLGDGKSEVPSKPESEASRNVPETASDRSESKSGAKEYTSTSKKDKKAEETAKRKTAKENVVRPPPPQERLHLEEERTFQENDLYQDKKKDKTLSQKNRDKKIGDSVINDEEAKLVETIKTKESEKKKLERDLEKTQKIVHQDIKEPVPVEKDGSSSHDTERKVKDATSKDSSPSSPSSKKPSSEAIIEEERTSKPKDQSELRIGKVDQAKSDTHPKDQSNEKAEDDTRTKPIKERPTKSDPSKDGPSTKIIEDPKVSKPQPPSIDDTKDSPNTKTKTKSSIDPAGSTKSTPHKDPKSKKVAQDLKAAKPHPPSIDSSNDSPDTKANSKSQVDPELPPSSPPSSQSRESSKDDDDVAKTTSGGGRDKAAADGEGDASKTPHVNEKTEIKTPAEKKPANKTPEDKKQDKKPVSVIDTLLEEAESLAKKGKKDKAVYKYEDIFKRFPQSAKALYEKAKLLDTLAEERRSNDLLENAIKAYRQAADIPACPRDIHKAALSRMADRLSFFGKSRKSIQVYQELVREYPGDYEAKKDLAVQYLIMGANDKAKPHFEQMLEINPMDGFALVHMGFILKTEGNYQEAIPFLRAGIDTGDRGTNEGKFFFQLGDSYLRTGEIDESYKVYDEAVSRGHFRSRYQRSLYNVDSLRGKPFWTPKDAGFTEAVKKMESNWETIRDEALALLSTDGFFKNEEEKLRETGDWKQFTLFAQGSKHQANCRQTPRTCEIFETIPESSGCKRGQVKFSVMHPGTHVWPHCGPTNCRLRSHLGLIIPQPVRLRVGNITRTWNEGKVFIFDDSFEHEVWQEADSLRLILIADLWHPDLTENDKRRLTPI